MPGRVLHELDCIPFGLVTASCYERTRTPECNTNSGMQPLSHSHPSRCAKGTFPGEKHTPHALTGPDGKIGEGGQDVLRTIYSVK